MLLGIMIVAINRKKMYLIPGMRKRENPYATAIEDARTPISLMSATMRVFLNKSGIFVTPRNSL